MDGSLFISYSHLDTAWMLEFKQHLEGMLAGRCRVWTDESIAPGTSWEETLKGNLSQAAAGLVLASPDYLVSPWCRRELATLAEAQRARRVGAVFWVLLRPCGWAWCELKDLQAVQEPADQALTAVTEGSARERAILHCCERIASGVVGVVGSENPVLARVRRLLRDANRDIKLAGNQEPIDGDFSVVVRALEPNGDDVYVKVLTNTPLHAMRELFYDVSRACKTVDHPSVIACKDVFKVGQGDEQRIVILSERARGSTLARQMQDDRALPREKRHLRPDTVRLILQRIAEALVELHRLPPIDWPDGNARAYTHLMGPLVPANIFYDVETQRPQISLVGVTNFIWHFFEPATYARMVRPRHGTYILPEKEAGPASDPSADQYFLGMLALELLEVHSIFDVPETQAPVDPLEYLEQHADRQWARRHQQLRMLIARLLAPVGRRFDNMAKVVAELRGVEDETRALAKHSYRQYIAPANAGAQAGLAFSQAFYQRFFGARPEVRQLFVSARADRLGTRAGADAVPDEAHHLKLLDALKSVLNYRRGGAPSSIDSVALRHVRYAIDAKQYEAFEAAFLATLRERMQADPQGHDEADEVEAAWRTLFEPVMREMPVAAGAQRG